MADFREFKAEGTGLMFYRCLTCHGVVSPWDIDDGGCQRCGGTRITPTTLTLWEKVVQVLKHPRVWEWCRRTDYQRRA